MAKVGLTSLPTRGRALDHAAALYDLAMPLVMLGGETRSHREIAGLAALLPGDGVIDLGCGTGRLTRFAADRLSAPAGDCAVPRLCCCARTNRFAADAWFRSHLPSRKGPPAFPTGGP